MISGDGRGAGRITKSGFKSILASVLIIAMLLSTMGGATYSWFSYSVESDVDVATGTVDFTMTATPVYGDGASTGKPSGLTVEYVNTGTLPIKISSKFQVVKYDVGSSRFQTEATYYIDENGNLKKSIHYDSIENNVKNFRAQIIGDKGDLGKSYVFGIPDKGTLQIDGQSAYSSCWQSQALISPEIVSGDQYKVEFNLSYDNGIYPYDTICDIPIQFCAIGVQKGYVWPSDNDDNEASLEYAVDIVHSESDAIDCLVDSTAGPSSIVDHEFSKENVVGIEMDESKREIGILSSSCIWSRIEEESGSIGDTPKAVAL